MLEWLTASIQQRCAWVLLDTSEMLNACLIITCYECVMLDTSDAAGAKFKSHHQCHHVLHLYISLTLCNV